MPKLIDLCGFFFTLIQSSLASSQLLDFNADCVVDLTDAVIVLQTVAGINVELVKQDYAGSGIDVNGDNRIGLEEALSILHTLTNDDLLTHKNIIFIIPGETYHHDFGVPDDEDWFMFYGEAGR